MISRCSPLYALMLACFGLLLAGCHATGPVDSGGYVIDADAPLLPTGDAADSSARLRVYSFQQGLVEVDREAYAAAHAALATPISIRSDEITLKGLVEYLRTETGLTILVNWPALDIASIQRDRKLSLHAKEMPARKLIEAALSQFNAKAYDDDRAALGIRDGDIHITSQRELNRLSETRGYQIDWLVHWSMVTRLQMQDEIYRRNPTARRLLKMQSPEDTEKTNNAVGSKSGEGTFFGDESDEDQWAFGEKIDLVIDLIQETVAVPDQWLDEEFTIHVLDSFLIVDTTYENHKEIEALLQQLQHESVQRFAQQAREMEVVLLLEEAEHARLEHDYLTALNKINHALRVDRDHPQAKALQHIVLQTLVRE